MYFFMHMLYEYRQTKETGEEETGATEREIERGKKKKEGRGEGEKEERRAEQRG